MDRDFESSAPSSLTSPSGFSDVEVGGKVHVLSGDAAFVPDLGVYASLLLPIGAEEVSADELGFRGVVASSWTLGSETALTLNAGVSRLLNSPDESLEVVTVFLLSGMISYEPSFLPEGLGVFGEFVADLPDEDDVFYSVTTGATYRVWPWLQLDLVARFGLNTTADDLVFGTGVSVLF